MAKKSAPNDPFSITLIAQTESPAGGHHENGAPIMKRDWIEIESNFLLSSVIQVDRMRKTDGPPTSEPVSINTEPYRIVIQFENGSTLAGYAASEKDEKNLIDRWRKFKKTGMAGNATVH